MRANYLDDDEYRELQNFLMLRWARGGAGKRGGLRIIYCVRAERSEFWMLTLYSKMKQENAPAHILKKLKEAFEND